MRALSIASALAFAAISAPAFADPPPRAGTILLFGARWCAPCMIEFRDLAAAAAPDRLTLAWIDRAIEPPAALAGKVDAVSAARARALASQVESGSYGLPFAAMLDADGHACAIHRGALDGEHIATLRRECQAARH